MPTKRDIDIIYYAGRVATSLTMAQASTNSCARTAHIELAEGYRRRLEILVNAELADPTNATLVVAAETEPGSKDQDQVPSSGRMLH